MSFYFEKIQDGISIVLAVGLFNGTRHHAITRFSALSLSNVTSFFYTQTIGDIQNLSPIKIKS